MKVGILLYLQTKLIAMTTNYMGVAIDNFRAILYFSKHGAKDRIYRLSVHYSLLCLDLGH